MSRRPRLLLSAYACAPERGSEHGVGWNWARELAARAEVWVVTRERRRPAIEAWERAHGRIGVHWVYHECPRWALALKRRVLGVHAYCRLWQRLLLPKARTLHAQLRFDAAIHLTMNGFREPGWLWRLPCRFAWGPIGGLQDAPEPLLALEDVHTRATERLRGWINRLTARWAARPRQARSRASLLLAANGEAWCWARGGAGGRRRRVAQLLEAGGPEVLARPAPPEGDAILWVGSDEARKNPRFALLAFAALRRLRPGATLTLVGLSPPRQQWLVAWARAHLLPLEGVAWHGRVPREALAGFYRAAAQFWFTSWRDTSGNVLLEAMAHGVPSIAFAHQGAADMLAGGAGVLVEAGRVRPALSAWVRESLALLDQPAVAHALGRRGAERSRARFAWAGKAELLIAELPSLEEPRPAPREPERMLEAAS
jgi:glycosyltransferase involved in cell wall biosynthesis